MCALADGAGRMRASQHSKASKEEECALVREKDPGGLMDGDNGEGRNKHMMTFAVADHFASPCGLSLFCHHGLWNLALKSTPSVLHVLHMALSMS